MSCPRPQNIDHGAIFTATQPTMITSINGVPLVEGIPLAPGESLNVSPVTVGTWTLRLEWEEP